MKSGGMHRKEGPAGQRGSLFKGPDAAERPPGFIPPGEERRASRCHVKLVARRTCYALTRLPRLARPAPLARRPGVLIGTLMDVHGSPHHYPHRGSSDPQSTLGLPRSGHAGRVHTLGLGPHDRLDARPAGTVPWLGRAPAEGGWMERPPQPLGGESQRQGYLGSVGKRWPPASPDELSHRAPLRPRDDHRPLVRVAHAGGERGTEGPPGALAARCPGHHLDWLPAS